METSKSRKVFITNRGGHSYEEAKKFGELVFVTEGTINRFAVTTLYRSFIDAFEGSSPNDYFLITSVNTLNAIGSAVFARKHGRLNLLLYREGEYIVRELDIDALLDIDEIEESLND